MNKIGFTTGCLYRSGLGIDKIIEIYLEENTNAIELSFATPKDLFTFQLKQKTLENIKKFDFITIHAPWKEIKYKNSDETKKIISKLEELHDKIQTQGIVLHPDTIEDFEILTKTNLPFLLENMDKRKKFGINANDFKKLKEKYNFGFILDLQHAFEHDPSMELAKELIEIMGERLNHLHVSGNQKDEIHVPVHKAINKANIEKMLKSKIKKPIILEGILLDNFSSTIKEELEFIKNFS